MKRYRPRIFALALHLTGTRSDADDVTQDAFLRAYDRITAFEGRSEFFTWLYRIALNRALNLRRDQGRRRAVDLEDPRVEYAIRIDSQGDPRRAVELKENYVHLLSAFDRLSPLLRTTVVLTTLQGLNYQEAAVVLRCTEGTIAWRVHEARKQMRQTIEKLARDPTPVDVPRRRRARASETHRFEEALQRMPHLATRLMMGT